MKKRLGNKESISKQGSKNAKSKPTLDAFDDLDADLAHGMDYMETKEAVNKGRQSNETKELNLEVDTARRDVDAARQEVSAVEPRTPLIKTNVEDSSRPARSVLTLKPLPSINPKDKGKGILVEEEPVKIKGKDQGIDQIERDEELAHKLHKEELAEIARIQEEKVAQEEASRVAIIEMFDEVQAGIDADALFTAKLQQEEREEYTIKERAQYLAETIIAQRKFRAAQRVAEIRSRPPTKSQLRNLMMTYLKNMGDDAVKDSKKAAGEDTSKKEEVLKEPDSTKIESMNKEDTREKVSDVSKKRKGVPRMKRMSKRKKTESDLEEEEDLNTFMKIVPDKERIIDYEMFETITPEDVDLVLWGDLRTMFDANTEDEFWQNQERWNLKSWNFYENYVVHTLTLEYGTEIHMLAKRKYPLTKETLERMILMKLEAMVEERRIFKCWFHHHTTNGHQFTMSNRHQELASPEKTASGKDFSNPLIADSLPKTIWFLTHHAS
ncbi:hypothetical protein Tco_1202619 [Tanacetum coccineum]